MKNNKLSKSFKPTNEQIKTSLDNFSRDMIQFHKEFEEKIDYGNQEKELIIFDKAKLRRYILDKITDTRDKTIASAVYVWIEDNREGGIK